MSAFFFIFSFTSLWAFNAYQVKKFFFNEITETKFITKSTFFVISFGFIISFTILSSVNTFSHFFGITLSNIYYFFFISVCLLKFNFNKIKIFLKSIFFEINGLKRVLIKKINLKNPFILFLIFIISIQLICLTLRFLLPVTHGDQLGQYFYDSLQISRLNNLSINEYYEIGGSLRTDSMASFFDALILQFTNNWTLVRSFRVISLILVVLSSIEMSYNLGNFSLKKSILLTCIIISLPDVWDLALSGKHDGYVLFFEMIGIYSIILSIRFSDKILKFLFSVSAVLIGVASATMRLSSLNFLLISIIILTFYIFRFLILENKYQFNMIFSAKNLFFFLLAISIISPTLIIFLVNYKFFNNPFYWISPPGFLSNIFPNAEYVFNYSGIKSNLSLNNIPIIFKSLFTFLYAILGLEPIRYGLTKFPQNFILIESFGKLLNFIGPKQGIMISMLSLSPFSLLPFIKIRNIKESKKQFLLFFITLWIILWTFSIPYTRVALASSITLIILGFSIPFYNLTKIKKGIYLLFLSYGLTTILLFSLWSFSTLYDLPVKSLFNLNGYSRTSLTRDYMLIKNRLNIEKDKAPPKKFEKDWKSIEKENKNNILILKKAPKLTAYFMTKGLLLESEKIKVDNKKHPPLCFQVDKDYIIENIKC